MSQQDPTNSTRAVQMDAFYNKLEKASVPRKRTHYIAPDNTRKFERHLDCRNPPLHFRFRPSVGNSSLLARRSRTNVEQLVASSSGSLVPTNRNFVDLVTPEPPVPVDDPTSRIDSGYISGPNKSSSPPTTNATHAAGTFYTSVNVECIPITTDPTNIPEYRATMEQTTEQLFFQKFVSKKFTYDSRKAREQLRPAMRRALDRPEDRPIVDKFYLHVNFKKGTIRGEKRRERLRMLAGKRAVDFKQRSWESEDYLTVR